MKENWTYKKLGEVCEILNGFAFKSDEYKDNGIRVMRITNVQKGAIVDDDPKFFPLERMDEVSRYILREGDVLMSLTGNVGRVGIITSKFLPAALNQRVACLRLRAGDVNKKYLFHILNSDSFEKDCIFNAAGIAQKNMSTKWLEQYAIPVPPLETQSRIVSELDLLQSIVDKQKAQLKELDTLAQAVFYDMFGDPVENEKGWEVKPLQEICLRITDGSHFSPKEDENGIYPMLTVKDMDANGFNYDRCKYISEKDYTLLVANGCKPLANDVLVAKDGSYLKTAFVQKEEKEQVILSSIAILTPNNKIVSPEYLAFFFKIPETKNIVERNYLTGTAIKRVILKGFKVIKISIPPLQLQQSFATKIESIEKQKTAIGKSIAEVEKLFEYTMDKYFG